MRESWRLITDGKRDAFMNMAVDEAVLKSCGTESPYRATLRFYRWERPTLSLGYGQPYKKTVREDFCRENGISVVRRATGGRAVLHYMELTYCFVADYGPPFSSKNIIESYNHLSRALMLGLKYLDIETDMSPGSSGGMSPDSAAPCFSASSKSEVISAGGAKVIGSAQRRWNHAFLQHGSIPLEVDFELLKGATNCGNEIEKQIAPLRSLAPNPVDYDDVMAALVKGFRDHFRVSFVEETLSGTERDTAAGLAENKYGTPGWNLNRRAEPRNEKKALS